jgi:hypothetical protein
MSTKLQLEVMRWLHVIMQFSILVPLVVFWWHSKHLSPSMRLAGRYVYVSGGSLVFGYTTMYFFENNHLAIVGFNVAKLLLFVAVYRQVLVPTRWTELLWLASVGTLCGVGGLLFYDWPMAFTAARIAQITILAAYALIYLDQNLTLMSPRNANNQHSPLWLLSTGLLLGTALAITASSLTLFHFTLYYVSFNAIFIIFSNMLFNGFLTLALLRSQPDEVTPLTAGAATSALASA